MEYIMKSFSLVAIFAFVSMTAFGADFQATATYCNGPVTNGDTSNCPAFSNWKGVALKKLKLVKIPTSKEDEQIIRLEDSLGAVWAQDLSKCISNYNSHRGCLAKVDFSKPGIISYSIETWEIGTQIERLSIFLNEQNSLTIMPSNGDQLDFSLE